MSDITEVLRAYGIQTYTFTKITTRLWKINSNKYQFALKRTQLNPQQIGQWKELYQIKTIRELPVIPPVYRTKTGEIFYMKNEDMYYLSPWIESDVHTNASNQQQILFATIGKLHATTKYANAIESKVIEQTIKTEKKNLKEMHAMLLYYIEYFEQKRYMPPFGLEVCTQYRDVEMIFKQLDGWYDNYLTDIKQEQTVYQSICHGYLAPTHHISTPDQSFLINWEHAYFGDAMIDLRDYVYTRCFHHDSDVTQLVQDFSQYEKQNPLSNSERSLLAIHLLNPSAYLQVISDFKNTKNQVLQIKSLLEYYRRLLAGSIFQETLNNVRNQTIEKQEKNQTD
ncbi:hypothetical protein GCM10011351_11270 [Paraliobacillus quinghaiensis]|uniref:Aminoglycoside phosphotransferase domain-containing protein n=1 Tax=Paraliobacillus quinghaiensis TaxID=470815 RepID=A0A917TLL1_9BACI|nr:hypothetical protein [Paraliobacillus quinghaiensis]GGM27222.1 hypothetical protein GCM10011351_11270 [Paraliobacillus quinghaiensis]